MSRKAAPPEVAEIIRALAEHGWSIRSDVGRDHDPKIISRVFASFEGMCWTLPSKRMEEIVWKVHWGQPTKTELMLLASAVSGYAALIEMPERLRRVRIRQLREALKLARAEEPIELTDLAS